MNDITALWRISERITRNNARKWHDIFSTMRAEIEEEFRAAELSTHTYGLRPAPALMLLVNDLIEQLRDSAIMGLIMPHAQDIEAAKRNMGKISKEEK